MVSDFDFSVENTFFEAGGAGEDEWDPGWDGVGVEALGAGVGAGAGAGAGGGGAGLDEPPMLRDIVCDG